MSSDLTRQSSCFCQVVLSGSRTALLGALSLSRRYPDLTNFDATIRLYLCLHLTVPRRTARNQPFRSRWYISHRAVLKTSLATKAWRHWWEYTFVLICILKSFRGASAPGYGAASV